VSSPCGQKAPFRILILTLHPQILLYSMRVSLEILNEDFIQLTRSRSWNTALTSDNVSRQLPCNGGLWARNEQATTPVFGLWDKSAAKMGNPITFLPVHRVSLNDQGQTQTISPGGPPALDTSNLGAVAYRIEATESLSQVSSFFLQQRVDFYNKQEVANWLTRFKELDLRLVQ